MFVRRRRRWPGWLSLLLLLLLVLATATGTVDGIMAGPRESMNLLARIESLGILLSPGCTCSGYTAGCNTLKFPNGHPRNFINFFLQSVKALPSLFLNFSALF